MRLLLLSIFLVMSICTVAQKLNKLECDMFYELINQKENLLLLDIRTGEKYYKSRIENCIWAETKSQLNPLLDNINKEVPIFIYCEIGKRSNQCSNYILKKGFKNIYELKGGFRDWIKNGYPVDSSNIKK